MVLRRGTPLTVSVVAPPDEAYAWVRLAGDVDMVAEPALARTVDRLDGIMGRLMVIDVAAVTFAGSTLAHFLDALHRQHPDTTLVVHRASPIVRLVVKVAGLDRFVVMRDDQLTPVADDSEHLPPAGFAHAG
jgi:anti-anti-sigma regulatory factor